VNPILLLRFIVLVLFAAGAWIALESSSVSAQTSGTDAIRMFDKDNDGTIDLGEVKAAAAALFDQLDRDHDGTPHPGGNRRPSHGRANSIAEPEWKAR